MESSSGYVLVIATTLDEPSLVESLLAHCSYPILLAPSLEQAVFHLKEQLPALVLLIGHWRENAELLVRRLRWVAGEHHTCSLMIISLTDVNEPHWLPQEENPGFDGFLVKPLSGDILTSLVQSAWIRQTCRATS